jgi:hypothetical protein
LPISLLFRLLYILSFSFIVVSRSFAFRVESILVGKPERKWSGRVGADWLNLAQDRDQWMALVNMDINLGVPYNVGKCLSSLATGSFSGIRDSTVCMV